MILASGSNIRSELLNRANLSFDIIKPRIDEESVKASLLSENASPRDIADCLAEMKAMKVGDSNHGAFVLGCDQVLSCEGSIYSKPKSPAECAEHLAQLSGKQHALLSAAVLCHQGKPIWRHVGVAQLRMRALSQDFINAYVDRNWDSVRHSVGGYKLEEEGVRLFENVQGDFFHVLGLPLLELLSFLVMRGELET